MDKPLEPPDMVGIMVYYPSARIFGTVKKVWDGEREVYRSTHDGSSVRHRVFELDEGHALMGVPGTYMVLEPHDIVCAKAFRRFTGSFVEGMMEPARRQGVAPRTACLLMEAALIEAAQACRLAAETGQQ